MTWMFYFKKHTTGITYKQNKEDGKYTYVLSHDMPRDEFPFAMEIGLIIDKN